MPTYRPLYAGVQHSEALADAYVFNPADDPVLLTVELNHATFGTPIRVVNDWEPLLATLEADAPYDAGLEVTFAGIPFAFTSPAETDSGAPGAVTLQVDNLASHITALVSAVQESEEPIVVLVRRYLPSDTSAPHTLPVEKLWVIPPVSINPDGSAAMQCSFGDLTNRKFPRVEYRRETHPTLSAA